MEIRKIYLEGESDMDCVLNWSIDYSTTLSEDEQEWFEEVDLYNEIYSQLEVGDVALRYIGNRIYYAYTTIKAGEFEYQDYKFVWDETYVEAEVSGKSQMEKLKKAYPEVWTEEEVEEKKRLEDIIKYLINITKIPETIGFDEQTGCATFLLSDFLQEQFGALDYYDLAEALENEMNDKEINIIFDDMKKEFDIKQKQLLLDILLRYAKKRLEKLVEAHK